MPQYCSISEVQLTLPDNIVIGDNLQERNVTILREDVDQWITFASEEIDSYLNTVYRVPLIRVKKPVNFGDTPIVYSNRYPDPIPLICARLTVGFLYDEIVNAQQEPNISDWGKNQRALAHDDLRSIQSGVIKLQGQVLKGYRFKRADLLDSARVPRPGEMRLYDRQSGL